MQLAKVRKNLNDETLIDMIFAILL